MKSLDLATNDGDMRSKGINQLFERERKYVTDMERLETDIFEE